MTIRLPEKVFHYVDVGAANYTIEPKWLSSERSIVVHLFEPDPLAAESLRQREPQMRGVENIVYETALGSKTELLTLNLCRKREVSSFFEPNRTVLDRFPNSSRFDVEKSVPCRTEKMDSVLSGVSVDFIKLDVQGFEYEVLLGARETLKTCLALQVEVEFVEMYVKQPLFGDVCRLLDNFGFEFFDFTTLYHYDRLVANVRRGQVMAADAVFVAKKLPLGCSDDLLQMNLKLISEGLNLPELVDYYLLQPDRS